VENKLEGEAHIVYQPYHNISNVYCVGIGTCARTKKKINMQFFDIFNVLRLNMVYLQKDSQKRNEI